MIIWLASYPKSGNTWIRIFLTSILYSETGDQMFIKDLQPRQTNVDVEGVVEKYSTPAKRLYGNSIAGADFWRVSDDLTIRQYVNAITS